MNDTNQINSLPLDPDVENDQLPSSPPTPIHIRPSALGAVFLGGTFGAAAREGLTLLFPTASGFPWMIFCINISGAFLLGALLEALARRGPDHGRRRTLRLFLGTGVMGGYTTYSSFATDTASLLSAGAAGISIAYALGTVLIGGVATWAGITVAASTHRRTIGPAS